MNLSMYISATALNGYRQKLDSVSHNIANLNTVGFKRREASFAENLAAEVQNQPVRDFEQGRLTPYGIRTGYGVHLGQTALRLEQGAPMETGQPLDLMIEGNGFFRVGRFAGEYGAGMEVRYTRDGSFRLSPSAAGNTYYLVNSQGDRLLDDFGNPIEIERGYEVKITEKGEIMLTNPQDPADTSLAYQRIGLVDIGNPQLLTNVGDNQFVLREDLLAAGDTMDRWVTDIDFDADSAPKLRSGFLEGSNVELSREMSEMMIAQRGFQLNSRALSYADQMLGIVNGMMK